ESSWSSTAAFLTSKNARGQHEQRISKRPHQDWRQTSWKPQQVGEFIPRSDVERVRAVRCRNHSDSEAGTSREMASARRSSAPAEGVRGNSRTRKRAQRQ